MSSNSVLYYPSIEFTSPAWVKSSLLIWDHVYRIVPKHYHPNDPDEIKALVDADFVRNITLERNDIDATADEFVTFCENVETLPAGLIGSDEDNEQGLHAVHRDKIDDRIYGKLAGMAGVYMSDDWLKMTPELARGYMFYLAKRVAQRRGFVRGTDDLDVWSVAPFYTEEANFNEFVAADNNDGFYTSMYMDDLLPADIGNTSALDIIHFARNRKDEKRQLRDLLDTVNSRILNIDSPEQIRVEVDDFITELIKQKNALKESMDFRNKMNTRFSLFAVGAPMSLTALGALGLAGNPFQAVPLASSVCLGAIAGYANFQQTQYTTRDSSHLSYLIAMDQHLHPQLPEQMMRSFEEFMND